MSGFGIALRCGSMLVKVASDPFVHRPTEAKSSFSVSAMHLESVSSPSSELRTGGSSVLGLPRPQKVRNIRQSFPKGFESGSEPAASDPGQRAAERLYFKLSYIVAGLRLGDVRLPVPTIEFIHV